MAVAESAKHLLQENEPDSALAIIANEEGDWALQIEIGILASVSEFLKLEEALNEYTPTDQGGNDFKSLYSVLMNVESSYRTLGEINLSEELTIRNIANKETPSGVAAQNILSYINSNELYPEIIDDIPEVEYRIAQKENEAGAQSFIVYPNPADDLVFIELTSDANTGGMLTIFDITSTKIATLELKNDHTLSWIVTRDLQPGIYLFEVISDHHILGVQKVVIN